MSNKQSSEQQAIAQPQFKSLTQQQLVELMNEYSQSIKVQKILFEIANLAFIEQNVEQFYQTIHSLLSEIIYAENIIIATLNSDSNQLEFVYFKDTVDTINQDELKRLNAKQIYKTLTGYVVRTGRPLLANKTKMKQLTDKGEIHQVGEACSFWMGAPLIANGNVSGVIALQSYDDRNTFVQSDLELLGFVASHISTVIHRKFLTRQLVEANHALTESHKELEEKVQQRTNDLVKSNYELHKLLREREKTQAKLYHDALHDRLTGLPNRTLFIDRLLQAMSRNERRKQLKYAVLFIDLDRFKVINDSLGHITGDLLLKEVSSRLLSAIRPSDSVARFGGDEFCILLEGDIDKSKTIQIAERIIKKVSTPYRLQGYEVFTSPSVGIAISQTHYKNPEEVLRDADAAMYQAKSQGKARYEFFDISMHHNALKRLQLETDLRVAIKEEELQVYFQPIVETSSKLTVGFEALVRWKHHQLGFISPLEFIEIAEETGLISKLGKQILARAIEQISIFRSLNLNNQNYYVSVNLSPKQLEEESIVGDILMLLSQASLPKSAIKLEITESILIDNFEVAKSILNRFDEEGIDIMLDDFGTGFSSLSYLHHFPIKTVKIDRSFVSNMFEVAKDLAVIQSVENLATGLGMQVVAEGVETEEQRLKLSEIGVNFSQGYLISKPHPPEELICWLKKNPS